MSQIYHKEPPTNGKVLLKTTYGEIEVELWSKEAPLACRNFVQHCLDGYYDSCSFFRIIPGFMAQTGDPENSGDGGESIWGKDKEFKDEFHSRLVYNHRGLVGMANSKQPNTNRSQFFLTFAACEWLNRKNTIFGRVSGDTIFNLMRLGEVGLDEGSEKPTDECQVISTSVLINPFDDVVPRSRVKSGVSTTGDDTALERKGNGKKRRNGGAGKVVKDNKLLSFEDDDGQEDVSAILKKKKKEKELQRAQILVEQAGSADAQQKPESSNQRASSVKHPAPSVTVSVTDDSKSGGLGSGSGSERKGSGGKRAVSALDAFRRQYLEGRAAKRPRGPSSSTGPVGGVREGEGRERATLDRLSAFSSSLRMAKASHSLGGGQGQEEEGRQDGGAAYHGQVLEAGSGDDDDDDDLRLGGGAWHVGKLKFKKHTDDQARIKGGHPP